MLNVKLFRIVTGEEVIAEVISEDDTTVTVQNGLVVLPTGQSVGFAPWSPVVDEDNRELVVSRNHIVYVGEISSSIKKKYNEIYGSKLITPEDKKLIL
mgnify:FL=1|jgi:hypothetical protein|tara:strand:+ start:223 stop:516 length:294 start_codon:yes stop_codon:yes gene_type:complete